MTMHSLSDQYWVDRQRDMTNSDRTHGLVNSMSVVDRSVSFPSAVIRARKAANREPGGVAPGSTQAA